MLRGWAAPKCGEQAHYPAVCAGCGQTLVPAGAIAYTGFQSVDLHWGNPVAPGLTLRVVDHRYYEASCACGHHTRARAGQGRSIRYWRV